MFALDRGGMAKSLELATHAEPTARSGPLLETAERETLDLSPNLCGPQRDLVKVLGGGAIDSAGRP